MAVIARTSIAVALGIVSSASLGCSRRATDAEAGASAEGSDDATPDSADGGGDGDGDGDGDDDDEVGSTSGWGTICDFGGGEYPDPCPSGECNKIDLLFVVDNSTAMGRPQLILSAGLPVLLGRLLELSDPDGLPFNPDVNIMFTTTDVGHPACTPFEAAGYMPAQGAPQSQACTERLDDFTIDVANPPTYPEACTTVCPLAVEPVDPFIHFSGPMATTTNVPGNNVLGAMQCLAPQGINGCGYESPLEAMLHALDPDAAWNQGNKPFLRDDALLAIVMITDEEDCSVKGPEGYPYFEDPLDTYWEIDPEAGNKTKPTSAVCWNAGVECTGLDENGIYEECHSVDNGVLHPVDRYRDYLREELIDNQNKQVVMLGILGVPPVLAHHPNPPFQPTEGGVEDLVYRQWRDGAYPLGDIIEEDETAASKQFQLGIGPGCTGEDGTGGFVSQATPPVRIKEVCQGLDEGDQINCCIESICATDYDEAFQCLAGVIQTIIDPIG